MTDKRSVGYRQPGQSDWIGEPDIVRIDATIRLFQIVREVMFVRQEFHRIWKVRNRRLTAAQISTPQVSSSINSEKILARVPA